ncbi:MAG: alcohol dehydrogenase catalytic domain-containing protein, partial [Deltaproteobacteria bacterium]|nr:alcohol dehydrogenase catalytic domain-containing protein [Deltaproteobacteria bacterium]
MRGLFFQNTGSLDNLQVAELPRPVPKAGEVLVQVHAAAINPSDVKNVLGRMAETKTPRVPGRDFAGRVVSGDSRWEGKSVFGTGGDIGFGRDGSHAEFVAVPVEGLVELPPDLSYENAAAIALGYFTAFAGIVRTGAVKRGETVLVTGTTGSVGSAAARVAAWKGARVLGTVRSSRDLGKRGDLPLVEWIDLESRPLPESVKELTEGKGKTKIIYCKDVDRIGDYPKEKFDFLGFEFRPRGAKSRLGSYFVGFLPAVSKKAAKSIRSVIRGWRLHRFSDKSLL